MGDATFVLGAAAFFLLYWLVVFPIWKKTTIKAFDELRSKRVTRH